MRIAVIGAGGVGGYFGGVLARHGEDVWFLARGPHLAALQSQGVRVETPDTSFSMRVQATSDPSQVGEAELVLFSVKTYDTDAALQDYQELLQRSATIISFQNGVDNAERIAEVAGWERVLGGVAHLESFLSAPGRIVTRSKLRRVTFGELSSTTTVRAERILQTFRSAGIDAHLVPNIREVIWQKFSTIVPMSALTSLTHGTVGAIRTFSATRQLLEALMREIIAVAAAENVTLAPTLVDDTLRFIDSLAGEMKTSLQRDFEAGHRSELESQLGTVVRLGSKHRVPTPVSEVVYACLALQEALHRGQPAAF